MKMDVEAVAGQALQLSPDDRVALAERLLASVGTDEQAAISRAWADEIERRSGEIETGKARMVPAEEVFTKIERKLRARAENRLRVRADGDRAARG